MREVNPPNHPDFFHSFINKKYSAKIVQDKWSTVFRNPGFRGCGRQWVGPRKPLYDLEKRGVYGRYSFYLGSSRVEPDSQSYASSTRADLLSSVFVFVFFLGALSLFNGRLCNSPKDLGLL